MQCPDCKRLRHPGSECEPVYEWAYEEYMSYLDKHPPARRTPEEIREVGRLEGLVIVAKLHEGRP